MLWGVDLNWPLRIRKWTILALADGGRFRVTQRHRHSNPIARIEKLETDVGKICVSDHKRALAVTGRVPSVKGCDTPLKARIHVDATDTVRPMDIFFVLIKKLPVLNLRMPSDYTISKTLIDSAGFVRSNLA